MNPQRDYLEALVATGDLTGRQLAFQGEPLMERPAAMADDGHDFVVPLPTVSGGRTIRPDPDFDPNDPQWRQYGPDDRGPRTPFGCFRVRQVDEFVDSIVDSNPDAVTRDWLDTQARVFFILNEWGDTNTRTNNVGDDPDLSDVQKRCIDRSLDKAFWYSVPGPCFIQDAGGRLRPLPCSMTRLEEDFTPEDLLELVKRSLNQHRKIAEVRART